MGFAHARRKFLGEVACHQRRNILAALARIAGMVMGKTLICAIVQVGAETLFQFTIARRS